MFFFYSSSPLILELHPFTAFDDDDEYDDSEENVNRNDEKTCVTAHFGKKTDTWKLSTQCNHVYR